MPKSGVFFVTAELQQVLDNLPADEPRSRLEPFQLFILRWRRERRSYERIRQILRDECQVKVSVSTLFKFVQRRSRPRKAEAEVQPEPVQKVPMPRKDQFAALRARMEHDKREPLPPKQVKRFSHTDQDCMKPHEWLHEKPKEK